MTTSEIQGIAKSTQKEWRVKTATGTPLAAVGDLLTQVLQVANGVTIATWFNNTTSSLFTVAPTVANLVQNGATGQVLSTNTNGRQSWHLRIGGSSVTSGTMLSAPNIYVDNVLNTTGDYIVPAGKVLRITTFNGFGGHNSSFTNANSGGYMAGNLCLLVQNGGAVTIASIPAHQINWAASSPSAVNGGTLAQAIQYQGFSIPDGTVEIAAGFRVNVGCQTANINSGGTTLSSVQCGWSGYLYDAS